MEIPKDELASDELISSPGELPDTTPFGIPLGEGRMGTPYHVLGKELAGAVIERLDEMEDSNARGLRRRGLII